MMIIFSASGDSNSFQRSSRILRPILEWMFPSMPEEQVHKLVTVARKGAHVTEYAILAILFWRAVAQPKWRDPEPWNWKLAMASILFVALYAATDELHQSTVPNRQGSAWDVLIDTVGAVIGILMLWRFRKWLEAKATRRQTAKIEKAA